MDKYSHTMKLDIRAPLISFGDILAIKRLNNLSIINEYSRKNKSDAITKLQRSIKFSKLMMKQAASLVEKMVAVQFLKLDLLSYDSLLDQTASRKPIKLVLRNLQNEDRTMLKAFKGEFAILSTSLNVENAFALGGSSAESDFFENIAIKYYLKRKTLENNFHKNTWLPMIELEKLTLASRSIRMKETSDSNLSWWEIYKDPIGYVLLNIAVPSYSAFVDKIDHIDAMITLLNVKNSIYSKSITLDKIENYISSVNMEMNKGYTGAKISWNKNKNELSFDIPGYKSEKIPVLIINY